MGFPMWAKHITYFLEYGFSPMWVKHVVGILLSTNKLSQKHSSFSNSVLASIPEEEIGLKEDEEENETGTKNGILRHSY